MKSPLAQIMIKILAAIMIIGAFFYFVISPKLSDMAENQIEIERLGSEMKQADNKLAALKAQEKTKDELIGIKNEVVTLLPDNPDASSFILDMESTSSALGIIINSLSVSEIKSTTKTKTTDTDTNEETATTVAKKTATEKALAFNTAFTSEYDKAQDFLKSLELLQRFNVIDNISFSNYRADYNTVNVQASGKIFYGK